MIKHKQFLTGLIITTGLMLSACSNALADQHVKMHQKSADAPVMVSTYDYQGQKVEQLKVKDADIAADKQIDSAIDVRYGENKIVHANNPMLIYSNLTNFADQYDKNIASAKNGYDNFGDKAMPDDKSQPLAGEIYGMFKNRLPNNGTVAVVKSKSGAPIGIFAGHVVKVKDFGNSTDTNALVTIDGERVFIYNAAYTLYPVSAMESMYTKKKATDISHQQGVKTKQVLPSISTDDKKDSKK